MIDSVLRQTGTKNLTFIKEEFQKHDWDESFSFSTLSCYYQYKQEEIITIRFTHIEQNIIEINPFFSNKDEQLRVEISEVIHQSITFFNEDSLLTNIFGYYPTYEFLFSDLIIQDFHSYETRTSLAFLFQNKKEFIETYSYLSKTTENDCIYENARYLSLYGKDGCSLASFLQDLQIANILKQEDEYVAVISFQNITIHYQFHIHYFKQMFTELGYTVRFLEGTNKKKQEPLFQTRGGHYELPDDFTL